MKAYIDKSGKYIAIEAENICEGLAMKYIIDNRDDRSSPFIVYTEPQNGGNNETAKD